MNFKAVVKKVVRTEQENTTTWRVVLEAPDLGHRISLHFGDEEDTRGYSPGLTVVVVEIKNPQQTLPGKEGAQ